MIESISSIFVTPKPLNLNYCVKVTKPNKGETAIYRQDLTKDKLITTTQDINGKDFESLQEQFLNSVNVYGKRKALGTRNTITNLITYSTYEQLLEEATTFGSGMINLNLIYNAKKEYQEYDLNFIGIMAKNRHEWIVTEVANMLYRQTMIPMYENAENKMVEHVLKQTNLLTIIGTNMSLNTCLKLKELHNLKNFIMLEPITEENKTLADKQSVKIYSYQEILDAGKSKQYQHVKTSKSDIFTFSYTSGTTGTGKACMMTHENFLSGIAVCQHHFNLVPEDVYMSYLPLAHMFDRLALNSCLRYGCCVVFSCGDILKIKDDLGTIKPTIMGIVPRLITRFYGVIQDGFKKLKGISAKLVQQATDSKLHYLHSDPSYVNHLFYDTLVFNKVKNVFGGRVRLMITGSAPIQGDILDFMKIAVGCPIIEAYGQTETTGASFVTHHRDPFSGHVGGPSTMAEFKLVDIPEMNYFSTDKNAQGLEQPRGEVCIRGPGCFKGYYKNDEATKETIDKDGWVLTGDVGTVLTNGALKIIDRKKNFFKLAQGEYIAPEKIQNVYASVQGIADTFVYGDGNRNFLVAIVVPDKSYVMKFAQSNGISGEFEELCKNPTVNADILKNLEQAGKKEGLNSLERVKTIYLEHEPFLNRGITTTTLKVIRFNAKNYYEKEIELMYK